MASRVIFWGHGPLADYALEVIKRNVKWFFMLGLGKI